MSRTKVVFMKMAQTTKQLQCLQKGGPFKVVDVPRPQPEPDQVLIRQHAVALNGLDWKQRDIGVLVERWPHVLGIESAGVVEAVGSDVHDLNVGDEVLAWAAGRAHAQSWGGAFQERIIMPAYLTAKKPKNLTLEQAASLPICYNTAVIAILEGLKVALPYIPGTVATRSIPKSVLVLGGSSSVGASAIQLLRIAYPSLPIFTTSSPTHHKTLISLGATKAFDYHSTTLVADIKSATPGLSGVDMIIDCVGSGSQQTDIFQVFDPSQSKLYSSVFTGVDIPVPEGVTKQNISGWSIFAVQGGKAIIPALTKLVEAGTYKLPLSVKVVGHGLDHIADCLDLTKTVSGEKLVVTV